MPPAARGAGTGAQTLLLAPMMSQARKGWTMPAIPRTLLSLLPVIGALAGCSWLPFGHHEQAAAVAPPAPQAAINGAMIAPLTAPGSAATGAPVYSGSSSAPAAPPRAAAGAGAGLRLTASEALALLANNTAIGLTDAGVPYMVYFGNDGAAHFREDTLADTGTWRVLPDGQVCSELSSISHGAETCFALARYGDVILYQRPDGLALGSIRVVAGNPQNL
jgi:hypothetical protein